MARLPGLLRRQAQTLRSQSDYWKSLPDRALLKLLLAVFFMFSTTGLVGHIQMIATTGKEVGVDGVEQLIARDLDRPLEEIHQSVMVAVEQHGPQLDDQTLLLIRAL